MVHNANLNCCKFVMTHKFTATSDDRPLPYTLLVMAILEEYNIKTDVGPKIKGTKHWEIDESSFHSGTDETPFRQPRPRRQPRATASTATTSTNPSLAEQMAALTATLSRIDTNVSKTAHNVNTLSREFHGYFDFVNYPLVGSFMNWVMLGGNVTLGPAEGTGIVNGLTTLGVGIELRPNGNTGAETAGCDATMGMLTPSVVACTLTA
ncbi:unnamed protein product [Cuscuta campestris]|uniref:Uncharacterized protein n=1 Tax=Cuscuta campestris TaxID=132261 RepID=A0A484KZH2_9ASTE|nr:unnamed protein product [Cuscuta campestris]